MLYFTPKKSEQASVGKQEFFILKLDFKLRLFLLMSLDEYHKCL